MTLKKTISGVRLCVSAFLLFALSMTLYAQENNIILLDAETGNAVPDVYYHYNGRTGLSDKNGTIQFTFTDKIELFLSHIQYGKLTYNSLDVKKALEKGKIVLQKSTNHLLPVTLLQVHSSVGEKSSMDFSAQHKLAHDAGSLLESVSSVSTIRKSGSYGFDPVLRGFKYDQINLVLDGVQTASAACPNRMDPAASQIPINMITQAEILKGPFSLRYGNVFGGTINFKSTPPAFKEKFTPLGRIGTSYESNGNIFRTEGVTGISGPKVDLRVFAAYSEGSDYTDGEGVDIAANFNRLNWGGKLGLKLSTSQTIGILVSNNFAKDVDFPALPMDLREDDTWLLNFSHSVLFYDIALSSWKSSFYGTKVNHLMDNLDKKLDPRKVNATTEAETANYGGRSELRFDFHNNYLFSGIDYRFESADGSRTREMLMGPMSGKILSDNVWQDAQIQRTGLFGEFHHNSTGFHLAVSGRLDLINSKVNNPDARFSGIYNDLESSHVHPSLSVGGTHMVNEYNSIGLWLGRATRSPGIAEQYINQFPIGLDPYEMLGNPGLDPEVNYQIDVVYQYQTQKTKLSVNLFTSFLRDYISSEILADFTPAMGTSPGVRQFVNIEKALMTGFEINWNQALGNNLSHNLNMVYTYGENKLLDEPLPEIPPFEFSYGIRGKFVENKVLPEVVFRHVLKQDRIAVSYGENKTPAFSVIDTKVSWLVNNIVSLTGGIQNLLDKAYYEHLTRSVRNAEARPIYSPGRSFYATLTVNFL